VESALVLLTVIVVLLGILDFSQFLFRQQSITERVRGVTRTASIKGLSADQIQNRICFGTDTAPTDQTGGYMGLAPANVNAAIQDATTTSKRVVVTVSGLRLKTVSPYLPSTLLMLPIRVTSPLETP
jgi:hypothetical protein